MFTMGFPRPDTLGSEPKFTDGTISALSGQLGTEGIASQEVYEALALCVSCKGCKRECPTGVDMARMMAKAP